MVATIVWLITVVVSSILLISLGRLAALLRGRTPEHLDETRIRAASERMIVAREGKPTHSKKAPT